ncbi:endonuclease domain-containing protein [Radicibacter daui]|uniref:endonuclease domain-containing protein n=1 Tax=Radicibacter daui TaxID=3064829 RepID=UPI004046C696
MTNAEQALWLRLKGRQLLGFKVRRQLPIGPYIADFCIPAAHLIIESDGGQHTAEADARRTIYLESQGWRVLRFWNNDTLSNIDGVLAEITRALKP